MDVYFATYMYAYIYVAAYTCVIEPTRLAQLATKCSLICIERGYLARGGLKFESHSELLPLQAIKE